MVQYINKKVKMNSIKNIMIEVLDGFEESTKVIYTFSIKTASDLEVKEVNVRIKDIVEPEETKE